MRALRRPACRAPGHFTLQQQHFQQVAHRPGVADDVVADGMVSVALAAAAPRFKVTRPAISLSVWRPADRGTCERAALAQQHGTPIGSFGSAALCPALNAGHGQCSATTRSCWSELWRRSTVAR